MSFEIVLELHASWGRWKHWTYNVLVCLKLPPLRTDGVTNPIREGLASINYTACICLIFRRFFLIRLGEWLVFKSDGSARCENKKYCKRFDNWHWWSPHQRCYRQFSQGPCKKGKTPFEMYAQCACVFFSSKVNSSIWTLMSVARVATANPNGMSIIGRQPKNALSKNLQDLVQPASILPIIPPHKLPNAIASKTSFMILHKAHALNSSPADLVLMDNWLFRMTVAESNVIAGRIWRTIIGYQITNVTLISNKVLVKMGNNSELIPKILGQLALFGAKQALSIQKHQPWDDHHWFFLLFSLILHSQF